MIIDPFNKYKYQQLLLGLCDIIENQTVKTILDFIEFRFSAVENIDQNKNELIY